MSVQQPVDGRAENQIVYEKKYFDYLPNDLDAEDVTDEDATHELAKSFEDAAVKQDAVHHNARRVNSRKFKRDLTRQGRVERQSIYYVPVPLNHYSPHPNIDFYFTPDFPVLHASPPLQSRFTGVSNSANYIQSNNPWSQPNRFPKVYPPYNFYLPAKPGNRWIIQDVQQAFHKNDHNFHS